MLNLPDSDAHVEYRARLLRRQREVARMNLLDARVAMLRFALFAAAAVLAWLSFKSGLLTAWYLLLPILVFLSLIVVHEKFRTCRRLMNRAVDYYERGIGRLENRWIGTGESGERFLDGSHVYAEDLDVFGRGSLFELICAARTRAGEATLAQWLKVPAAPAEIRARQAAVGELRGRLDLREELAILGDDAGSGVNADALSAWATAQAILESGWVRTTAVLLSIAAVLTLALWAGRGVGRDVFLLAALVEVVFTLAVRKKVRRVVREVEHPGQDLTLLSQVLKRLERERFGSPKLGEISQALFVSGVPASGRIAVLNRLIRLLDSRRNMLFAPIAALLLWEVHFAFAIEAWRKKSGPQVARWLEAVGEMEALCSFAGYAFEHPADPFAELAEERLCLNGEGLGHPLIPESSCARNDVNLGEDLRVLVVSGSNMSGKSTLLRTVGANAILALAGAPVRARRLRISPVAVGASIQRRDSLQEGVSRFYAEITRLRQLTDVTKGPLPLLFLVDELLAGTNSHDRAIGAAAVVGDLVKRGAAGLLTTHDLALTRIAEELAPFAANVHFEDFMKDGKLVFDYRLRPGVVQKSNALELMRSIGLLP